MLDQPLHALSPVLARGSGVSRPALHAGLLRLCQRHVQRLRSLLREPAWEERSVQIELRLAPDLEKPDWRALLSAQARWGDKDHLLVFSAALLRALDERHKTRRSELGAQIVEVPLELGGGRTLFLPPPSALIEGLVPERRRLGRGQGDLKSDVRHILGLWWHLVPLEGRPIQPDLSSLPPGISEELALRLRQGDLRIGICSPFSELNYLVRTDAARCHARDGVPYRFAEMAPECLTEARQLLSDVIDVCARERIDLLCFPELTLDTTLLGELSRLLKLRNETLHPALIMAGSFHVDSGLARANRCTLLDGFGNLVLTQDKCTPYSMPGDQVVKLRRELRERLGLDERGGYEDIEVSTTLTLVESPIGRLALPICLDFCGDQLRELLVDTQANLLLVPAMTPRMAPFYSRARDLGTTNRATIVVANSAWLLRQIGLKSPRQRSFTYFPARKGLKGGGRKISDSVFLFTIREALRLP